MCCFTDNDDVHKYSTQLLHANRFIITSTDKNYRLVWSALNIL